MSPRRYEINVFFAEAHINDPNLKRFDLAKKHTRYIPLTDFRFFGVGNIFQNQRHVGYNRGDKLCKAKSLTNLCMSDLNFTNTDVIVEKSWSFDDLIGDYECTEPYITTVYNNKIVFIKTMEVLRFFMSSFGQLSSRLVEGIGMFESVLDVCDQEETGWVANDIFQISPKIEYCDVASALQLSMILTNPDLANIWASLAKTCRAMQISGKTVVGQFPFPELSSDLTFMSLERRLIEPSPLNEVASLCRRIISDRRPAKFKRLRIMLPHGEFTTDIDLNNPTDDPVINPGKFKNLKLKKGGSNKFKGRAIWSNLPGLLEAFPNLADIKLTVIRTGTKISVGNADSSPQQRRNLEGSSGSQEGFNMTPSILFKPPLKSRQLFGGLEFEQGEQHRLFEQVLHSLPEVHSFEGISSALNPKTRRRFISLFEAVEYIRNKNGISENFLPNPRTVLEMPASWGAWATINNNRGRFVAVGGIYNNDIRTYTFELEHRIEKENTSIGMVSKTSGQKVDLYDLGCILNHCQSRIKLRGNKRKAKQAYIGIWPDETEYIDIVGKRIIHSLKRSHPHYLAQDLISFLPSIAST